MIPVLTGLVVFLSVVYVYRKPIVKSIVGNFIPFFFKHRKLGEFLGIKYTKTSEWETNRKETSIMPVFGALNFVTGSQGPTTPEARMESIYKLKRRQRERVRDFNLLPYFNEDRTFTVEEFERYLIKVWIKEISESMNIKKPENENEFIDALVITRAFFKLGNKLQMLWYVIRHWGVLKKAKPYWQSLNNEERTIMMVPFLTTIDSTLFNFLQMSKPKKLSDLFQKVPFTAIPMDSNGEIIIADIVANDVDNPGNSVFGPKGVICPGNIVTSMLVKAMIELMNNLDYQIIGVPKITYKGYIGDCVNASEIRIKTKAFNKEVVQLDCEVDDNEND